MERVGLIFPPFVESALHGPHLALPLLASILRTKNIHAEVIDLNIRIIRDICKQSTTAKLIELVSEKIDPHNQNRYLACLSRIQACSSLDSLSISASALKVALRMVRELAFPCPPSLAECLQGFTRRPSVSESLYQTALEDIASLEFETIGITVAFSEQLPEAIYLARLVRRMKPNVRIILGGSQINLLESFQISMIANVGLFDAISVGNGEQIIVEAVQGSRGKETRIIRSGPMGAEALNAIPTPDFTFLDQYFLPHNLPVLVTKGCYWGKCTFCDYPRLSDIGGKSYIARTPKIVFDEMRQQQMRYSPDQFVLISDAVPPSWYKELAQLAVAKDFRLRTWSYMMHSKSIDREFLCLLSKAGVSCINFGTESTNDRILLVMRKQCTRDVIFENLKLAHEFGLKTVVNIIPDYPTICFEEALSVADDIRSLLPIVTSFNPQMFDLTAGTPAAEDPEAFSLDVPSNAYQKSSHGYHSLIFKSRDLSPTHRKIINRIFLDIKREKIIQRTKDNFSGSMPPSDLSEIRFDRTSVLVEGDENRLWLIQHDITWPISTDEASVFKVIFETHHYSITFEELRTIYTDKIKCGEFITWFQSLADSGIITDIIQSDRHLQSQDHGLSLMA